MTVALFRAMSAQGAPCDMNQNDLTQFQQADPATRREHIEFILEQIDALPTLSTIASRLLHITSDDRSSIRQVTEVIESDPALTARILKMVKRADLGISTRIVTVDRAVTLLGFTAVRNAVLSLEAFQLFGPADAQGDRTRHGLDRVGFWKHSLGVAVTCELIARHAKFSDRFSPEEAFVCGLLHDLGKLALDCLLPQSYEQVIALTDRHLSDIGQVESKVLGLDHHTAGKRLGERWNLPATMVDCMWLHGQPYAGLPEVPHKRLIGLVNLADHLTRIQHIGYSGNHTRRDNIASLCEPLGLAPEVVVKLMPRVHEQVAERAAAIGLGDQPAEDIFVESVIEANRALSRINEKLLTRSHDSQRRARALDAIEDFLQATDSGQSTLTVSAQIAVSAGRELGEGRFAVLTGSGSDAPWRAALFTSSGQMEWCRTIEAADYLRADELREEAAEGSVSPGTLAWLGTLARGDLRSERLRVIPLRCRQSIVGVLVHDRDSGDALLSPEHLEVLSAVWGTALGSAMQHESTARLGEQLVSANRKLAEAQSELARVEARATVGEMAAGAAHEMNNPLCIISGRAQVLARSLRDQKHKAMAEEICDQSHRLSDLITSLRLFGETPEPRRRRVNLLELIGGAARAAKERVASAILLRVHVANTAHEAWLDDDQVSLALLELIVNALEAAPKQFVVVEAYIDDADDRLIILVRDDGCGMSENTLRRATDPFFSDKPAGRQPGLGLARARRLVEANGGRIELESRSGEGTTARMCFEDWRTPLSGSMESGVAAATPRETAA